MKNNPVLRVLRDNAFLLVGLATLALVIGKAAVDGMTLREDFGTKGNDDIMRLLSVRDWLGGQGWFDVRQYRLIPPEGVSLHWSRYIDAGIAAIIVPMSWFFSPETAELIAVTAWPTLIMVFTLMIIGFGTRRVFGVAAACFAMLCTVIWPLTADLHSSAGNLDHHNVQFLMMVIMAFAVIWPSRPIAAGIIGGFAGAFSLAVGLESLVFIVGVGMVLLVHAAFAATRQTRHMLIAFCLSLGAGSTLFWLGQTGPDIRMDLMCDQLAPPTLSLVAIAMAASLLSVAVAGAQVRPIRSLGVAMVVTAGGLALAWPLLAHCLAGPYAQIPPELQELISTQIAEAKPGIVYAISKPAISLVFVLPIFAALIFGGMLWVQTRRDPIGKPLAMLLILCLIGLPMMLLQMRTVIIAASVVPMIGGAVIAQYGRSYFATRDLKDGLLALVIAILIVSPVTVVRGLWPLLPSSNSTTATTQDNCRRYTSLNVLNDVPPAVVLSHVNYGTSLMWATHHAAISAPYHRSTAAFMNGIVPFQMEAEEMKAYTQKTSATHLLLCRGYSYKSTFVRGLAMGETVDWLRPVPLSNDEQMLFEILR
ncbi:hypothetical protein DS901_10025 [Loktanella sp. D2R18]|uniref:hypothetical protein n=1 Tax=Rhodobacterales TaxID=204455 RepID=UPI000DEB248D|nr:MULTISPECIES: hypothetical protein [Rhodobacterales]MDO6591398.1 hypothetical protein [Yoonia sp. 1_MG-2023]RBW43533.1 hypothetical protein DS901_10025 [Loktanella sp. D2R18]